MNKIFQLFKSSKKYSIKWSNYFEIYERILKKYVNKKVTLVEVGVGDGGSLFMWRNFLGNKAKIIGVELNPDSKKLKKFGFKIFNGDQSNPNFWKNFYKKIGKIDILIDDGGHTNLQQITTFMESFPHIRNGGSIIIEDTHTSYMNYKGFKNPSKNSFINFSNVLIENIHRRNPMIKRKMDQFSKKIYSIEYYDSIVCININKRDLRSSQSLENNKKLRMFFTDFRFKKINDNNSKNKQNWIIKKLFSVISRKGFIYRAYENFRINKYLDKIRN